MSGVTPGVCGKACMRPDSSASPRLSGQWSEEADGRRKEVEMQKGDLKRNGKLEGTRKAQRLRGEVKTEQRVRVCIRRKRTETTSQGLLGNLMPPMAKRSPERRWFPQRCPAFCKVGTCTRTCLLIPFRDHPSVSYRKEGEWVRDARPEAAAELLAREWTESFAIKHQRSR